MKNKLERIPKYRIINGIIAFLGGDFRIDNKSDLYRGFHILANDEKYKELLDRINFYRKNGFLSSPQIESIFDNLLISRLVYSDVLNNNYGITPGFNKIYEEKSKEFFGKKEELIRKASGNLRNYLTKK